MFKSSFEHFFFVVVFQTFSERSFFMFRYLCIQDYKKACNSFLDGLKLEPENIEMKNALRYPLSLWLH